MEHAVPGRSGQEAGQDPGQASGPVLRSRRSVPLPRWAVAGALLVMAVAFAQAVLVDHTRFSTVFEDLGELAVAALAAGCAGVRAARQRRTMRERRAWALLALSCGAWAVGQAVWSWYEVWRGVENPFPSPADIGFLVFPVAACAALLVNPVPGTAAGRGKRLLDALMVTTSLALVSWLTVLSAVLGAGDQERLPLAVSLAYPVTDLPVLVLTILTLARMSHSRLPLRLLAVGLACISVSDSGFAYLTSAAAYEGGLVDLGWFAGFLLLALAALAGDDDAAPDTGRQGAVDGHLAGSRLLPYVPVVLALAVVLLSALGGRPLTAGQLLLALAVVALLLARQYATLRENLVLTAQLEEREAELRHQAFHDNLTGLANRALFLDRLTHALDLHVRDLRPVSVLFLDLDDFKVINDKLGHGTGDQLLVRVAERLLGVVRQGDTVARLGGDEFAVLLEDAGDPLVTAAKVAESLRASFPLPAGRLDVRASIGVFALQPADSPLRADDLLRRADVAMYTAKRSGKDQVAVYTAAMAAADVVGHRLDAALSAAVAAGEIRLAYQPVVELATGRVMGLEALARWRYEGREVPPDLFIPAAERTGTMGALTGHVLRQACEQLAEWSCVLGHDAPPVAVNVPPAQLLAAGFVDAVCDLLERHDLARSSLTIEITESGRFGDPDAGRAVVDALRAAGVKVALDDFGTGYSSLAQLSTLSVDTIKIDRCFIHRLDVDPQQVTFLQALLRLARDMDLHVVVEGIERPEQLAELRRLDCPAGQGYLLDRPLPPEAVLPLLRRAPARTAAV